MSTNIKQYETTLNIPWGRLQDVIEWCTDHCQHDWHFGVVKEAGKESGTYKFMFDSEIDYITFLLVTK